MQPSGRYLLALCSVVLPFLCAQISFAQEVGDSLSSQSMLAAASAVYADFYTSITWPDKENGIGFKGINIGDVWPLDDKRLAFIHDSPFFDPNVTPPFDCKPEIPVQCHLQLWNSRTYPNRISDLQTAFGEKIFLDVSILPEAFSLLLKPGIDRFGSGRVIGVTIENRSPSLSFVSDAVDFLSEKLGYSPTVRKNDREPSVQYSANCASRMAVIGKKPIAALTPDDLSVLKGCRSEYISALIAGSAAGTTIRYEWQKPGSLVRANVISTLTMNSQLSSALLSLEVDAGDQLSKFGLRMAEITNRKNADTKNKSRKDF